jgi:hypothetical protein
MTLGVPEITPVVELKTSPVGSAGDTVNVVTDPPAVVGTLSVTALPLVYTQGDVEYDTTCGGMLLTATFNVTVVELPSLAAVTTYVVDGDSA